MRMIAVLTGSRGDYSIYRSVLDAIDRRRGLDYRLIVTGMHLSKKFGSTINEIKEEKRKIGAIVPMLKYEDTPAGMVKNTAFALSGITKAIEKITPEVILVLGDRGEQLAAAIAGAHMNIAVAHLHGGEVSGTIDESIRHAITKFAHIHLAATKMSVKRLIKLGERPRDIHLVGAPGIDAVKKFGKMGRTQVARQFSFDPKAEILLAVQHPVTSEYKDAAGNMRQLMEAIIDLDRQTVFIYANSDAGFSKMMSVLERMVKRAHKQERIKIFRSLPHELYLSLMKQADVMIGNSSSGVIEAPSCATAYVLVGSRQEGREKASSVIESDYNHQAIIRAVDKALYDKAFRRVLKSCRKPYDPFGDADSGRRVARVLAESRITPELLQKRISY